MAENGIEKFEDSIRDKIYTIRGYQVMLDRDLAELYGVETKRINEAVKRNKEMFPDSFCFQPNISEYVELRRQFVTSNDNTHTLKKGGTIYMPYAFTEQGVAMLVTVLRRTTAIKISIQIIEAFVEMLTYIELKINNY